MDLLPKNKHIRLEAKQEKSFSLGGTTTEHPVCLYRFNQLRGLEVEWHSASEDWLWGGLDHH